MTRVLPGALVLMLAASSVAAQDHLALKVIRPMPSSADPSTGLDADHRVFRQPTGVDYVIRVEAIGGEWPYAYSLSNAPTGMTIVAGPCVVAGPDCTAGTITWTNPQATASDIVATVTDRDGDQASATWTVTVSALSPGAGGACFISEDAGNDTTGSGTEASPWRTLDKAQASCGARSLLFLMGDGPFTYDNIALSKTGTSECFGIYDSGDPNSTNSIGDEISFSEASHPVIWIDYPEDGLRPVVNVAYTQGGDVKPCLELVGQNIWINGITFTNCIYKCLETQRSDEYGATYWDITVNGTGIGAESHNSAAIMYAQRYSQLETPYYDVVSQSTFTGIGGAGTGVISCIKKYSQRQSLVADNLFDTVASSECIANKSDVQDFTDRNNVFQSITGSAIGGNNHGPSAGGVQTRGEILFNNVKDSSVYALEFNQDGQAGPLYIYRNTFDGVLHFRNTDASDGPFTFTQNVIINAQAASGSCPAKFACSDVTDYTRLVLTNNLTGVAADGIIDADGALQGSYRTTYLGTRGFEVGGNQTRVPFIRRED